MARKKEQELETELTNSNTAQKIVSPNSLEWTDYVLSLLSDDEKISGNPTTDGLRRIFEIALNCLVVSSTSNVVQSPNPENEKRATVVHEISFILNNDTRTPVIKISGAADVYWGNCDKVYRNHPVAVAETRAEGRALRRALKLRKVVAAEEIAVDIEDHPDNNTVSKISNNQINSIDILSQRLNINMTKLLQREKLDTDNIFKLSHSNGIDIFRLLNEYQRDIGSIPNDILGYNKEWK